MTLVRLQTLSPSSSVSLPKSRPRIVVFQVFFVTAATIFTQHCEGSYQMKKDGSRHVLGDDQLFASQSSVVGNGASSDDTTFTTTTSSSIRTTILASVTSDATIVDASIKQYDDSDEEHETLIFEGTFECQSDLVQLLPGRSSPRDLLSFFQDPSNRHVVLKGGGNPVDVIPTTPRIFDEWTRRARLAQSTPPEGGNGAKTNHHRHGGLWGVLHPHQDQTKVVHDNMNENNNKNNNMDEEVLAIHSDAAICPGLAIDAISYTGCKLTVDPQTSLPRYEFTLLHDTYRAKGRRPMVWIFDRVTGADSNSGGSGNQKKANKTKRIESPVDDKVLSTTPTSSQDAAAAVALIGCGDAKGDHGGSRKTYALSCVTILPEGKGDKSRLWGNLPVGGGGGSEQLRACRVSYFGHVRVACKLPRSFLHFLPIPKHKVEERVSKSIVMQLEKEGVRSVQQLAERLSKWTQPIEEAPSSKPKD